MGILCSLCLSKEEDNINDDNKNNDKLHLNIENKSPEIIMNINPIKEFDRNINIMKEEKKAKFYKSNEYDIKSSKTQTNLLNFKKDNNVEKIVTKLIYNNHEINEEEGEDDPLSLSKSKSTFKSIILQKEEHKNKIINMDPLIIRKKSKSEQLYRRRRKKRSNTVKHDPFLFMRLFSNDIYLPISQEKLIWEKKGMPNNNYIRGELIGKGNYGKVYESKNTIFNNKVAMKVLNKKIDDNNEFNFEIENEINTLKKLSHPNIVKIYEFYESNNCFYLINEYCQGGELYKYIKDSVLTENQLCVIFYQVFSGLIYLHEKKIIHEDLKPQNILISSIEKIVETNEDYAWIKIIDFNTAKTFEKYIIKEDNFVGTLYYIAPEVYSDDSNKYDEKRDIWSVGIILYMALTKRYPFIGRNDLDTIELIQNKDYNYNNKYLLNYSEEIQDLIKNLLIKDPSKRPSAKEALNHKWFKRFNGRRLFTNFNKEEMIPYINNIFNFSVSKLHKLVIAFLVHNLPETESSNKILKLFRYFNKSGDCKLSKDELKNGLKEFRTENEIEEKIDKIFKELDGDNSGTIEFEEFLRACINKNEILNDKYLHYAFKFLDKENRKLLSPQQIIDAFIDKTNIDLKNKLNIILNKIGYDKNGFINFEEFKAIINSL